MREQQRKEGLRAREHRSLRTGRTGETDIVADVLEHALEQADHKDRPVFAALRTNAVSHAGRDEQHEHACEREAHPANTSCENESPAAISNSSYPFLTQGAALPQSAVHRTAGRTSERSVLFFLFISIFLPLENLCSRFSIAVFSPFRNKSGQKKGTSDAFRVSEVPSL